MSAKKDHRRIINDWVERNLTQEAKTGSLTKAFEVDGIIDQLSESIQADRNPIVTGESGIGKTSVIHELIRRIEFGRTLTGLRGKEVLQLSLRRRASALKHPDNQMRPEMQKLVAALLEPDCNIIPYFRDLHLAYTFDLEPQLQLLSFQMDLPILAEGERTTIQSMLEDTPELSQQFITINLDEPSLETALRILTLWSAEKKQRNQLNFSPDSLEEALYLSHRFLARDRLPRKALDLLTHAGSLAQDGQIITGAKVIERFCSHHRVPLLLIDPAVQLELQKIENQFRSAVLGQEEAIQAVVQMISMIKSGLSDMRRPFGAFLFVGPTGVGKTHLAQFLAKVLFGSRERIIRLNMADYPDKEHAQLLFGDPDDRRPAQVRGILTLRITGQPFAVLLLEIDRKEAAELLTQINQPGFWDQLNQRDDVLDRYRALDVAIRMQERFARSILHLAELCEDRHSDSAGLAAALEQAAVSNRQWEERLAGEGHTEVWMVLASSDPLIPADKWIRKMANMELAWCRQLGLTASIVAYSVVEHKLNRTVLEIEGPGAEIYLSMEQGIHRLHFPQSPDFKIRVEIMQSGLPKNDSPVKIQSVRHRRGEFNLMLTCKGQVKLEERGLTVDLVAEDESILSRLLPDLAANWRRPPVDSGIARIYGKDGVIHDPRTGVTSSRIKNVWKGQLDEFLEAWRRARG